ncbi:MAG: creatininase family protein [Beijerinckiaceae bacterium]|nr:creatininase family protein [Beijerinckiaceae bacterium]
MASVMWKERTAPELNALAKAGALVILPVASMEQHGPHLAVGVDTYLCESVCRLAAERVAEGACVVAPTLWVGMAEHHMALGGTFTLDIPTYRAVLLCLLKSIERHGFKRVLIVNGHGGNIAALGAFLPDFARETTLFIRAVTYFELAKPAIAPLLEKQSGTMHACEVETSMMMALQPNEVRPDRLADAHGMLEAESGSLMRPVVARYRPFADLTPSGVIGDARVANREKGEALVAACAQALADWISGPEGQS